MTQREGMPIIGAAAVIAQAVALRTVSVFVRASPALPTRCRAGPGREFARPAIMTQREGITRFGAAAVIAQAVPLRTVSAIVHASPSLRAVSLRATRAVKTRRLPLPARLLTRSAPAASLSP